MSYTMETSATGDFDKVVERTVDALEDEGFGVLCDIDVRSTFEEKLGEEFRQYHILGACTPTLAHEGLTAERDRGALLPCNVIVYETDHGDVTVDAVDPQQFVGIADNDALDSIATDVTDRFERVLSTVDNGTR